MRVLLSTNGSHRDLEPTAGPAVRLPALGADLSWRAAELIAAKFGTVPAAAEECDALVATGVMPAGVRI